MSGLTPGQIQEGRRLLDDMHATGTAESFIAVDEWGAENAEELLTEVESLRAQLAAREQENAASDTPWRVEHHDDLTLVVDAQGNSILCSTTSLVGSYAQRIVSAVNSCSEADRLRKAIEKHTAITCNDFVEMPDTFICHRCSQPKNKHELRAALVPSVPPQKTGKE